MGHFVAGHAASVFQDLFCRKAKIGLSLQNATLFVKTETGPGSGGKLFCVPGTDQSEKGLACPAAAAFLPRPSNNFKDTSIVRIHPLQF